MPFSITTWNIQGKRRITKTNFKKIAPALGELDADILCLQEAIDLRAHLPSLPELGSRQHVFPSEGYNQNAIFSKFPIVAQDELDFPFKTLRTLERALWADICIGNKTVRVYNCHFTIFGTGAAMREKQLNFVLDHAEQHDGPAIVCGDFNTTVSRHGVKKKVAQMFMLGLEEEARTEERRVFDDERHAVVRIAGTRGFREAADISEATWRVAPLPWEPFKLKLDWLLVRGIETSNVVLHPYVSDHKAIRAECVLQ